MKRKPFHPIVHCAKCGVQIIKKIPSKTARAKYCGKCGRGNPWNKGKKTRGLPNRSPRDNLDQKALAVKPESMMAEARTSLGKRYSEKNGLMYLNGRPASLGDVVLAANKIRFKKKEEQLGKNPAWHFSVDVEKEV